MEKNFWTVEPQVQPLLLRNATVSASEEFGFSVVQYAGSSSAISVAHGLPSAPDFMLVKKYNASGDQFVAFHVDVGNEHALRLNDQLSGQWLRLVGLRKSK